MSNAAHSPDRIREARDALCGLILTMKAWRSFAECEDDDFPERAADDLAWAGGDIERAIADFMENHLEALDLIGARSLGRTVEIAGVEANSASRAAWIMVRRMHNAIWLFDGAMGGTPKDHHKYQSRLACALTELANHVRERLPDFDPIPWQTAVRDEFGLLLGDPPATATDRPSWTTETRTLAFCGSTYVIKHNSGDHIEAIFRAFAEANWPPRIESPLPGNVRTSSVLQSINNAMARCGVPLRFKGDGTKSIAWETVRMQRHATE